MTQTILDNKYLTVSSDGEKLHLRARFGGFEGDDDFVVIDSYELDEYRAAFTALRDEGGQLTVEGRNSLLTLQLDEGHVKVSVKKKMSFRGSESAIVKTDQTIDDWDL